MNNLPIELSETELKVLHKIQEKLKADIDKQYSNLESDCLKDVDTQSPYAFDDIEKPIHISNEDRELIFHIRGEISTIDHSTKTYLSLDTCLNETYHIPIPSGCDLQNTINEFMSNLELTLKPLAQKIYDQTK